MMVGINQCMWEQSTMKCLPRQQSNTQIDRKKNDPTRKAPTKRINPHKEEERKKLSSEADPE